MKSINIRIITTIIFFGFIFNASAQSNTNSGPDYSGKLKVVGVGLGIGGDYGVYSGSAASPLIDIYYDQEVYRYEKFGVITAGGMLGEKSYKYTYGTFQENWRYYLIGARAAFHITGPDFASYSDNIDPNKLRNLDLYGGLILGYYALSYSNNNSAFGGDNRSYGNHLGLSLFVGGRYYFTNKIAGDLELGFGASILNIGLSYKL